MKFLLGAAIRSERLVLGLSQEEFAERAGLHRTYISDVERGTRNPSIESVAKLAGALRISLAKLFDQAGKGSEPQEVVEILLMQENSRASERTLRVFKRARITNPVRVIRDGAKALDFVFSTGASRNGDRPPQMILLDLDLQRKKGIEVLRQLKADARSKEIPVVILVNSSRDANIDECRRLGAANYIIKPMDFQNFSEAVAFLNLGWRLVKPLQPNGGGPRT